MPENKSKKIKKPFEHEVEIGLVVDNAISNGTVEKAEEMLSGSNDHVYSYEVETESKADAAENKSESKDENIVTITYRSGDLMPELLGLTFSEIKDFAETHTVNETLNYLKDYIAENKSNPEVLQNTISWLMEQVVSHYDSEKNHMDISMSEIMGKMLTKEAGEEIPGLVCTTIHEFAMNLLKEAGLDAVLVFGNQNEDAHATLLYQQPNGKYVFNNYGAKLVIDATNIKDAVREVSKHATSFETGGYLTFSDGKLSYQEFALKQESAFGQEMDKRSTYAATPFDNANLEAKSSVGGNFSISTNGNIKAQAAVSIGQVSEIQQKETALSLEYKQNSETALFEKSKSIGTKVEFNKITEKDDSKVFIGVKNITTYTQGERTPISLMMPESDVLQNRLIEAAKEKGLEMEPRFIEALQKPSKINYKENDRSFISTFVEANIGKERIIAQDDNLELKNAIEGTLVGGATFPTKISSAMGDLHGRVEDGVQLITSVGNMTFQNQVSAGVTGNLGLTSGDQKPTLLPGFKFNAKSSAVFDNSKLKVGASIAANNLSTASVKEWSVGGNVFAQYRPENSNVTFFGNSEYNVDRQRITLGGFQGLTEDTRSIKANVGAHINKNATVYVGYSKEENKLNKSWNNSTFTIGGRISF